MFDEHFKINLFLLLNTRCRKCCTYLIFPYVFVLYTLYVYLYYIFKNSCEPVCSSTIQENLYCPRKRIYFKPHMRIKLYNKRNQIQIFIYSTLLFYT